MKKNPQTLKYKKLHELSVYDSLPEYYLYFTKSLKLNQNVYNEPRTAECAALIVCNNDKFPDDFDICIYPKQINVNECTRIN